MAELQWGPVVDWCQISASADRPSYKASEGVFVTVVVRNVADRPAPYQPYPFAPGVDYQVIAADGKLAELTAFGRQMKDSADICSEGVMLLQPGEQVVYEIFLNRDYDLTIAGRYKFQVVRQITVGPQGRAATASSNAVEVEVREER